MLSEARMRWSRPSYSRSKTKKPRPSSKPFSRMKKGTKKKPRRKSLARSWYYALARPNIESSRRPAGNLTSSSTRMRRWIGISTGQIQEYSPSSFRRCSPTKESTIIRECIVWVTRITYVVTWRGCKSSSPMSSNSFQGHGSCPLRRVISRVNSLKRKPKLSLWNL